MGKKNHKPPAPPTSPAPAPKTESVLEFAIKLLGVAVLVVGVITLLTPWMRQEERSPPPGWVCWHVERSTADSSRHDRHCEPAAGWHVEEWPGIGRVSVPDNATIVRRHYVRD